jgi:hypothetical protein
MEININKVAPNTMRRTESGICMVVNRLVIKVSTIAPSYPNNRPRQKKRASHATAAMDGREVLLIIAPVFPQRETAKSSRHLRA